MFKTISFTVLLSAIGAAFGLPNAAHAWYMTGWQRQACVWDDPRWVCCGNEWGDISTVGDLNPDSANLAETASYWDDSNDVVRDNRYVISVRAKFQSGITGETTDWQFGDWAIGYAWASDTHTDPPWAVLTAECRIFVND